MAHIDDWGQGKTALYIIACLAISFGGPLLAIWKFEIPFFGIDHLSRLWILNGIFFAAICILAGLGYTKRGIGIIIDRRNMLSLSKLQMIMWTGLVVVTFVTIAAQKMAYGIPNPLDIAVPETLWILMGISITAFIGSPIIKSSNFGTTDEEEKNKLLEKLKDNIGKDQTIDGTEVVNTDVNSAKFSDLFRGEEVGNFKLPDLGKIQMFMFTLIVWATYAALIYQMLNRDMPSLLQDLANDKNITNMTQFMQATNVTVQRELIQSFNFPDISSGMNTLLAISTAGYLGSKAVPRENPPPQKPSKEDKEADDAMAKADKLKPDGQ